MGYYKKIVGDRLYLSPVDAQDADIYLKWMNEDQTLAIHFGQYPRIVSGKEDLNWLFAPPEDMHRFAIVRMEDDELLGSISLHNIDHLSRSAYPGVFLGGEGHRNQGYGAESMRLLLRYGFETLNLHSVHLTVHADNAAGIACYKKVGFREVGRQPEVLFIDGRYVDKVYMSILESTFADDCGR